MNDDLSVREQKCVVQIIDKLLEFNHHRLDIKVKAGLLKDLLITNEELNDDLSSREEAKVVKYIKDLQWEINDYFDGFVNTDINELAININELAEILLN